MKIRRRSPPPATRQSCSHAAAWPSPRKAHPRRTARGIATFLMCSLLVAWSSGLIVFFVAFHANPTSETIINDKSLTLKQLRTKLARSNIKPRPATNHFQLSHKPNDQTSSWSWPMVHIVSTRFMQGQGDLISLARSRLKLLEVICLPSVMKQTIFDVDTLRSVYNHTRWARDVASLNLDASGVDPLFLWVIKVDPNIDKSVMRELTEVLEPVKKYTIVVGSNSNYEIGKQIGGWRDGKAGNNILEAFQNDKIFFPNDKQYAHDIVSRAHRARSDRVVLETRLDADDAVNLSYFAVLHYTALKDLVDYSTSKFESNDDEFEQTTDDDNMKQLQSNNQKHETARWIYWCPHRHVQWNPSTSYYNPNKDPGMLSVFESPNVCVTPGLTLGFALGTEMAEVPRYEHTHVYWEINQNNFDTGGSNGHDCGLYPSSRCAVFVENPFVSAFRSRAMTSAGTCEMAFL